MTEVKTDKTSCNFLLSNNHYSVRMIWTKLLSQESGEKKIYYSLFENNPVSVYKHQAS